MPGLASGIAGQIRKGEIKKFLIQPIDMIGFLFSQRLAHKLVYYTVATIPFAVVFWLCRGYFPGWPDAMTLAAFAASLIMAFLLGFFLEATLGMIGFWFLEVGSLLVRLHAVQLFLLRAHVSPGHAARRMGADCRRAAAEVPGLFLRGRLPGEDYRGGTGSRPGHAARLGAVLHGRLPRGLPARTAALQRLRRMT